MGKNVVPPDIGEEEVAGEEVEEPEKDEKEEKTAKIEGDMPVDVKVALERISTQITALNEIREGNNERFARLSEQVGEIEAWSLIMKSICGVLRSKQPKLLIW